MYVVVNKYYKYPTKHKNTSAHEYYFRLISTYSGPPQVVIFFFPHEIPFLDYGIFRTTDTSFFIFPLFHFLFFPNSDTRHNFILKFSRALRAQHVIFTFYCVYLTMIVYILYFCWRTMYML